MVFGELVFANPGRTRRFAPTVCLLGVVGGLQEGEAAVGHVRVLLSDDTHNVGVCACFGDEIGADFGVVKEAPERLSPHRSVRSGDAGAQAGGDGAEDDMGDALPEGDAALAAVVEQRGGEQRRVPAGRSDAAADDDAVLLVAERHRFEEAALGGVEVLVRGGAVGGGDAGAKCAEELTDAMAGAADHVWTPVKSSTSQPTAGTMISDSGL